MDLVASLQNLGLTEKEAKVYLALLQLGKATAYSVAIRANLKNPTAYVILENLIAKGIAQKVPRAKKALYVAISPEDLFSIAKGKIKNAEEEALPELKSLSRGKGYQVRASYYEGLSGIKEMYSRLIKMMKGKEYIGFFAHEKDAPAELLKYFDELNEMFRKNGIKRRGITVYDPIILERYLNDEFTRKYFFKGKALPPEKYNSNISIEIYKNYVQIFSHRYLQATVIENPDVANVMRQIFELIWEREDIAVVSKG
ncbi:MAG: helix-turn-helix domain-containing protein [bacterium]|nr:helix-turn-helix domain-containing protein [bacterium]